MSDVPPALAWVEGATATAEVVDRDGVLVIVVTIASPAFEGGRVEFDIPAPLLARLLAEHFGDSGV